jgi:hypothetical protein
MSLHSGSGRPEFLYVDTETRATLGTTLAPWPAQGGVEMQMFDCQICPASQVGVGNFHIEVCVRVSKSAER